MPKVLIITYYWPPAGGSGVQRWLKFTKYLRNYGWEPVIYTALNPEAPGYDKELLKEIPKGTEVIKRHVWEPYTLFRKLTGRKDQKFGAGLATQGKSNRSFLNRFAIWARGNLFIPDARMFWIRPSAKYLTKYLKDNPVDIIVSTGPPHSTHLIALKLHNKLNIPWVADFRDPWTDIDFFRDLMPSKLATLIHKGLEKKVLTNATRVVTVTVGWGKDLISLGAKRLEVIENGFDAEDFNTETVKLDQLFSITHIGTLSPNRNCNNLWLAIGNYARKNEAFARQLKIRFVGSVDNSAIEALKANELLGFCDFLGYISHSQTIEIQKKSQVLLLLVNNSPNAMGIQTGKVFEYLAAKRPIFAVGPKGGDTEALIDSTNSGLFLPFDNRSEIEAGLEKLWSWYSDDWKGFNAQGIEKFSRNELTRRMAELFNRVVKETER